MDFRSFFRQLVSPPENAQGISYFHLREKGQWDAARPLNKLGYFSRTWFEMINFYQDATVKIIRKLSHDPDKFGPLANRAGVLLNFAFDPLRRSP